MIGNFFSHQVQILHYKLDQYANFQCPGIIRSILECGLLLTLPFLPMPDLNTEVIITVLIFTFLFGVVLEVVLNLFIHFN